MQADRERFRRQITSGANALALYPEEAQRPQLKVVNPEIPAPINIVDFLKRRNSVIVEIPNSADVLTRQQVIKDSPEANSGRFIEGEMNEKKPWSAFGQLIFTKEHTLPSGEKIKKWVGFSISYPGGVGERMTQEILRKTLEVEDSDFESWNGQIEGKIMAAHKPVADVLQNLDLMDKFIDTSEEVIKENHAKVENKLVQHFMGLQPARRGFLSRIKQDALEMLLDPEFVGRSTFIKDYEGKGVYLIGGAMKMSDGVWCGPNTEGELVPVSSVVTNEHHAKSVGYIESKIKGTSGDSVIVDGDSTEDVHYCGGVDDDYKRGCSEIFQQMEGGVVVPDSKARLNKYLNMRGVAGSIAASKKEITTSKGSAPVGGGYDSENCSTCGKNRSGENGCKCSQHSKAA